MEQAERRCARPPPCRMLLTDDVQLYLADDPGGRARQLEGSRIRASWASTIA